LNLIARNRRLWPKKGKADFLQLKEIEKLKELLKEITPISGMPKSDILSESLLTGADNGIFYRHRNRPNRSAPNDPQHRS
jgi:hypothetical protein